MNYSHHIPKEAKLTAADIKFVEEHIDPYIDRSLGEEPVAVKNPYTSYEQTLNPVLGSLVIFVYMYSWNQGKCVQDFVLPKREMFHKFDRARDIVRKIDMNVYMKFID